MDRQQRNLHHQIVAFDHSVLEFLILRYKYLHFHTTKIDQSRDQLSISDRLPPVRYDLQVMLSVYFDYSLMLMKFSIEVQLDYGVFVRLDLNPLLYFEQSYH
ncbi:hypothetical protein D3C87_1474630 [compost metagenome]